MIKNCKLCGEPFELKSPRQVYCKKPHNYVCKHCGKSFERVCGQDVNINFCDDCKKTHWLHVCTYCGQEFITDVAQKTICDRKHYKECPECGKQFVVPNHRLYETVCCSPECANKLRSRNIKKAIQYKPHGYNEHTSSKQVRCKYCGKLFTTSNGEKYCPGPHYATCIVCGKQFEIDKTQIFNHTKCCSDECRQRYSLQTVLGKDVEAVWNKFSIDPVSWIAENFPNTTEVTYYMLSNKLHIDRSTIQQKLKSLGLENIVTRYVSTMEQDIYSIVPSSIEYLANDRLAIKPYELDIYFPDLNFAIECDPTYTHNSSAMCHDEPPKPSTYHKMKTELCKDNDIELLHIFGYDWSHHADIITSMIRTRLGIIANRIYARKCEIVNVDYRECKQFLDSNHLQGNVPSKVRLGLKYNGELVSVMTFGSTRSTIGKKDDVSWELLRFCNKLDTSVVGGASKLFKYFVIQYEPRRIVSFSDVAHTSGKLYPILGFNYLRTSDPGYVWVDTKTDKAYHRMNAQKQNIKKFLKDDSIDLSQSESQIMVAHGFVKVYDCGNCVWEWLPDNC